MPLATAAPLSSCRRERSVPALSSSHFPRFVMASSLIDGCYERQACRHQPQLARKLVNPFDGPLINIEPGIQSIAQAVSGKVKAQHSQGDHDSRIDCHPGRIEYIGLGVVEHV